MDLEEEGEEGVERDVDVQQRQPGILELYETGPDLS